MKAGAYIKLLHRAWKYRFLTDRYEISYMMQRITPGSVVFDIGAHKGGYTFWMKRAAGSKGRVIAFEPQEKGAALLAVLYPGIRVERLAVSDQCTTRPLHIQPQSYEVSFEASLEKQYEGAVTEQVNTTTIDAYCRQHHLKPQFIKIDVEGHELAVLRGACETLRNDRPFLLIECEERHAGRDGVEAVFTLLSSLGYKGYFFRNKQQLPVEQFSSEQYQVAGKTPYINNFVFEPSI